MLESALRTEGRMRTIGMLAALATCLSCDSGTTESSDDGGDSPVDVVVDEGGADETEDDASVESDGAPEAEAEVAEDAGPDWGDAVIAVSGNAFVFGPPGGRVEGAEITVLEFPGISDTTDADGAFGFDALPTGFEATFVLTHEDQSPYQTGTFTLGATDLDHVSLQSPTTTMFNVMAAIAGVTPDPATCQIASTVARVGGSLYGAGGSHGEAGATVTIEPPLAGEHGPIYFNLDPGGTIYPDRDLTATTEDGGVLFVNVPPGDYVLTAHKDGMTFTTARMKCRAGFLVNASPPWGLQAQ